jgi:hypothetical protein
MKLRPLIIGPAQKADIARLRAHAEAHPVSAIDLVRDMNKPGKAIGDDPAFVCVVSIGYRCVFSLEHQPVAGLCRHLSMSVLGDGAAPNEEAVKVLAGEFGFTGDVLDGKGCLLWIEDIGPRKVAINLVQKV